MAETPVRKVRVDDELWNSADATAKANGENIAVVIRRSLIQYVALNALPTVEATAAGKEATYTPDGVGGGVLRIPHGDPTANRSDRKAR